MRTAHDGAAGLFWPPADKWPAIRLSIGFVNNRPDPCSFTFCFRYCGLINRAPANSCLWDDKGQGMRRIADIDGLSINALWSIKTFRDEGMHRPFVRCNTFINSVNWKIRKSDVANTVLYNLPYGLLLLNYYRWYRYLVTIRNTRIRNFFQIPRKLDLYTNEAIYLSSVKHICIWNVKISSKACKSVKITRCMKESLGGNV